MKGVNLSLSEDKCRLIASIDPLLVDGDFNPVELEAFVKQSEFAQYSLNKEHILALLDTLTTAHYEENYDPIKISIGDLSVKKPTVRIDDDQMSATLTITVGASHEIPSLDQVMTLLHEQGLVKGVSHKRIHNLLQSALDAKAGTELSAEIARGLSPRDGKDSFIKPLVPNALERILIPVKLDRRKVDMRNLGDILCVDKGQAVAKRIAPSKGRLGQTVTGQAIKPACGKLKDINLGGGTSISSIDENIIVANIIGQPKFENGVMTIDDTFTTNGVNVGTGNIEYNGAVIVNGDVTENMEIIAKGDVTINGFVESAYIRSGGDIIITEGATGKMHDEDCRLIASGSVFVQHAQGLDIIAGKDVNVAKQLAYSRVKCKGGVTIGAVDHPMGNIFASTIQCGKTVRAGSVGAVSGSTLTIDFSEGYNILSTRIEALSDLCRKLASSNANHEVHIANINSRHIPQALRQKLSTLNDMLAAEQELFIWLKQSLIELRDKKQQYEANARVIANKELFPGVSVKLNKQLWRGQRENLACRILLNEGKWLYEPITRPR